MSEEIKKRPVGRPRKTPDDLPSNWREIMRLVGQGGTLRRDDGTTVEFQGGGSINEASIYLGIDKVTYYEMLDSFPDFLNAEQERDALCLHWWETVGKDIAKKNIGSAKAFEFQVTNRFRKHGYSLRKEIDHTSSDGSLSPKPTVNVSIDTSKLSTQALAELYDALVVTDANNAK